MKFDIAVPVLQVSNVAESVQWYKNVLGFDGWAFPETQPRTCALLRRDESEIMLQVAQEAVISQGWAVYIQTSGNQLLELAQHVRARATLSRELELMPYRDVEFSVSDPDGHEIVVSEQLSDDISVSAVGESEAGA